MALLYVVFIDPGNKHNSGWNGLEIGKKRIWPTSCK
jgi:hypothetical protein